ncbi:hypothetical protein [Candidatus Williamhamiltonella defendens]|nr:hypothetical protein [Candidatus Hamiltonella defensa]
MAACARAFVRLPLLAEKLYQEEEYAQTWNFGLLESDAITVKNGIALGW